MLFGTDVDQAVQKSSRRDDERLASNDVTPLDPQAGHMIAFYDDAPAGAMIHSMFGSASSA